MLTQIEHEEYGSILVNPENNTYVLGSSEADIAEFITFNESTVIHENNYDTHEEYLSAVKAKHTEIIAELKEAGYSVQL